METIQAARLAAELASRLNRPGEKDNPATFFQVREETFEIVSRDRVGEGAVRIGFQFEGLVRNLDEPVTYLASGSVLVGSGGEIRFETLEF